jgi:hypothetical protein
MFGGIYYWFDKITGVAYNEILGQIHFWIFFIGVNFTFFPMHFLGVAGMPRRVPDYPDAFYAYNKIASWGSYISAWSILVFFFVIFEALTSSRSEPVLKETVVIKDKLSSSFNKYFPLFVVFVAILFLYFEQYRITFIAIGFLILNYSSIGLLVKDFLSQQRTTREHIKNDIKKDHFYLYYLESLLGVSVILGFILLFTMDNNSVFVQNLLGILVLCYILVSLYKLIVTKKYYQKYNSPKTKNHYSSERISNQKRNFHATTTASAYGFEIFHTAFRVAQQHHGTIAYCTECAVKFGLGYVTAHTYSNNRFVSPNLFTNAFNSYAPTGLGFKYVPNSFQPTLHDYIVTQRSLRGEELIEFHKTIIDNDGYMNTEKAQKYAKEKGILLPSHLFEFGTKKD